MIKWSEEIEFLEYLIPEVYQRGVTQDIEVHGKGSFDLVTTLDYFIERKIGEAISQKYPGDIILGEEYSPSAALSGRAWVIDPIDGTVNMARGIPLFGIQVALIVDKTIILSVMFFPKFSQFIKAEKGKGAFCNGKQLHVVNREAVEDLMVTFGDFSHKNLESLAQQQKMMIKLSPHVLKIRMFGAASYDFLSLAFGQTDAHVVLANNPWDIFPGILICQEAGAEIRDITGQPYAIGANGLIVASSISVINKILEIVNS